MDGRVKLVRKREEAGQIGAESQVAPGIEIAKYLDSTTAFRIVPPRHSLHAHTFASRLFLAWLTLSFFDASQPAVAAADPPFRS